MALLEHLANTLDTVLEFLSWRRDWRERWNPVAFWLAVVTGIVLILAALGWAREIWYSFSGQ